MSNGKPWEDAPDLWKDEQAFMSKFLRSSIRKIWARHPIKHRYTANRVSVAVRQALEQDYPIGCKLSPQTKKLRQCEMCLLWWPVSKLQVDHLDGGYGYTTYTEMLSWMERMLWVGFDDIQEICLDCHDKRNVMQKNNCEMWEVPYYKERTLFNQQKAAGMKRMLTAAGLPDGKNETERKALYESYLQEKHYGKSK